MPSGSLTTALASGGRWFLSTVLKSVEPDVEGDLSTTFPSIRLCGGKDLVLFAGQVSNFEPSR
jgi:hypothetical protein